MDLLKRIILFSFTVTVFRLVALVSYFFSKYSADLDYFNILANNRELCLSFLIWDVILGLTIFGVMVKFYRYHLDLKEKGITTYQDIVAKRDKAQPSNTQLNSIKPIRNGVQTSNLKQINPERATVKGVQHSETEKIDAERSSISQQSSAGNPEIELGERTLTVAASLNVPNC